MNLLVDSEGPDQIVRMDRLILAFTVCIYLKTHFHMAWSYYFIVPEWTRIQVNFCVSLFNIMFFQCIPLPVLYNLQNNDLPWPMLNFSDLMRKTESEEGEDPKLDSLAAAINYQV